MELPFEKECMNEDNTRIVANEFASLLLGGDIVALNGNLGSGKTFFVNSVCEALGVDFTNSPTFSIVNEYNGKTKIFHFDFYRIEKKIELYDLGFEDYLNDMEAIMFIEWANMIPEVMPKNYYLVEIEFLNNTSRKIKISKNG